MIERVQPKRRKVDSSPDKETVESLYLELLKRYYEEGDRKRSRKVATRLDKLLAASPDYAHSIRGEEIRSIIAELRDNYSEAIQSREAEIRKILELQTRTIKTDNWKYVSRQYDFSDVSDRLELLAILYDKQGDLDRAIAILLESKQYCQLHDFPFDGNDLLEELEQEARTRLTTVPFETSQIISNSMEKPTRKRK
jgi:tetratricopeptide (TPR) repeat protein